MEETKKKAAPRKKKVKKIKFVKHATWLGLAYFPGDVVEEKFIKKDILHLLKDHEIVEDV